MTPMSSSQAPRGCVSSPRFISSPGPSCPPANGTFSRPPRPDTSVLTSLGRPCTRSRRKQIGNPSLRAPDRWPASGRKDSRSLWEASASRSLRRWDTKRARALAQQARASPSRSPSRCGIGPVSGSSRRASVDRLDCHRAACWGRRAVPTLPDAATRAFLPHSSPRAARCLRRRRSEN